MSRKVVISELQYLLDGNNVGRLLAETEGQETNEEGEEGLEEMSERDTT